MTRRLASMTQIMRSSVIRNFEEGAWIERPEVCPQLDVGVEAQQWLVRPPGRAWESVVPE